MAENLEQTVIEAAKRLFLRYGYKRVTMAEIAQATHISRPALYLVFRSKEDIFSALLKQLFAAMLDEIRQGVSRLASTREQLIYAFDIWTVRPFQMTLSSPDAKDLYESCYEFGADVMTAATAEFVSVVVGILDTLTPNPKKVGLSSLQIAQILVSAVPGFKTSAQTVNRLKELIDGLISMVLAGLDSNGKSSKRCKKST